MVRDRLARQSRRGLRDLERIAHCAFRSGGGAMRAHLLTTTAAVALLAALPARAQDATWSTAPGSSNFNTAANWTPATVPTGTAFFGASNTTSIAFQAFTTTSVGTLQFNPGAPAYSFTTENGFSTSISITGTGIVNNSSNAPTFIIGNQTNIFFRNASTAGNATIITNAGGLTAFVDSATGGDARFITTAGGAFDITSLSSGGMTAGSIEGAGTFSLGPNQLTVGSNNLSTEVSGVIRGTGGSLIKIGTGIMTLSGINTYTGPTTVNAGVLIVNGSIASSSLTTVNSGAALIGSGTVGSTVVNSGGFLVPGPVGTPGAMTVAGNLALQSGAFYIVQVNPGAAATTNVSGTAALAGTVGAIFLPGSYMTHSYTILSAAGGLTGTFDALRTAGLPAGLAASLSFTGNTAVLNLTAQLVPGPTPPPGSLVPSVPGPSVPGRSVRATPGLPVPSVPGLPPPPDPTTAQTTEQSAPLPPFTVNQLNVGRAIDNFFNNGGALPPAFVSLYGLSGANLTTALDQLSGEAATGAQQVGFQLGNQFLNLMLDPFVDGRSGIGGADHPALGFAPSARRCRRTSRLPIPPSSRRRPRRCRSTSRAGRRGGGAYGGSNRTSGDLAVVGSHDLSASTAGFAGGLDYHLTPDTVAGFALAGGGTHWSLAQGLGGGKSDAFQAGVYGATRFGPAYLAAAFAFTNHWMSTDRLAVGDRLTASFNAQSYGGRIESGYRFGTPYGGITPYAAIQAQSFHTPGYTETDAIANGFALTFNGRDASDTRSELGTRFDRVLAVYSNAVLALRGRVAWAHDWVSDPSLLPAFQALPGASFIVNGATPAKNSALASAGAELRLANGFSLLAKFDGEFASHSTTYAGTGTVRYVW
jgi:autotransporter-associated beta strand protein